MSSGTSSSPRLRPPRRPYAGPVPARPAAPAAQQPTWPDPLVLDEVVAELRTLPPLVFAGECDQLNRAARRGGPRRGVPAAGRRLRRDLRRRDRRLHPQQDQDAAADGGRAHLRRPGCRWSRSAGSPGSSPSRAAPTGDARRRHPAGLPRRRRQRPGVHRRGAHPRPAPAAAGLPLLGRDAEPAARLHPGRLRRPAPGARLEPGLRPRQRRRTSATRRWPRDIDRALAFMHACGVDPEEFRRSTSTPATRRCCSTTSAR